MLEGCRYFLEKKYKKVKFCTLLRHFRAFLRDKHPEFSKVLYSFGVKDVVKHTHLTKYVRKHGADGILDITGRCDVDLHLGTLPPELLKTVKPDEVAQKTKAFFTALDKLTGFYGSALSSREHQIYELSEIGDIFGTHCVVHTYKPEGELGLVHKEWAGAFGDVYKLCFPEIGVEYALKVYKGVEKNYSEHGSFYEIPTAFCANKTEPQENNPIYLGRLHINGYMLSKWQEKQDEYEEHTRLYQIYETSEQESDERRTNFINGVRIDFGETRKTWYGELSAGARKWYRFMEYRPTKLEDVKREYAKIKGNFDKDDFYEGTKLHFLEYVRNNRTKLTYTQIDEIYDLIKRRELGIFDKYFKKEFEELVR